MTTLANEPKTRPSRPATTATVSGFMGSEAYRCRPSEGRQGSTDGGGGPRWPAPTIPSAPDGATSCSRTQPARPCRYRWTGAVCGPGADVVLDPEAGPALRQRAPAHWPALAVPSAETSFWPVEAVPLAL